MTTSGNAPGPRAIVPGSERRLPADASRSGDIDPNEIVAVTVIVRAPRPFESAREPVMDRAAFAARFGAQRDDIAAVERFALAHGLIVTSADLARRSVVLEGTVAALGDAFGAKLALYGNGAQNFRGRSGPLTVPADLAEIVVGVFGLDDRPQARAQFRRAIRPAAAASTSYTPLQIASAYGFPGGLDGSGQTIALIELGGGYVPADLDTYFGGLGLATPTVVSVGVDGGTNTPTGNPSSADGEVMLDIEVAGVVAPGARIVVYFAPNTDRGFLDAITTAIHDTASSPSIVSISWGGPESSFTAQALTNFDDAFAAAAMLGVTILCAAGDNGSSDGVGDGGTHVDFPSSSPHALACGGTRLVLAADATITDETVWNDGAGAGATGGGISAVFPRPDWQVAAGVPATGRGVPDVAGDADPQTGYAVLVDGNAIVVGGTSAVAPLYAGLLARVNQQLGKPVGFINARLYANPGAFRDIVTGNNGAFSAGPGWDACTGLGSPDGAAIAKALGGL